MYSLDDLCYCGLGFPLPDHIICLRFAGEVVDNAFFPGRLGNGSDVVYKKLKERTPFVK